MTIAVHQGGEQVEGDVDCCASTAYGANDGYRRANLLRTAVEFLSQCCELPVSIRDLSVSAQKVLNCVVEASSQILGFHHYF
ncbi:MAG: hypothetical protein KGL39_56655 [Patescibacteria group bacterium]|nr:hypothetical protein [Patescibacteria group bacterium]